MSFSSQWFSWMRGAFVAGFMLLPVSLSQAAVVENFLTFNPKAYALGNAVTADYVGIDSLQYNPAALINLQPGFSTEFKLLGAPLVQIIRQNSPQLVPKRREFTLFYRGYSVRCDSPFQPFSDLGIPSSISANPGRDPVSGGLDPSIPGLNYNTEGDLCFGPELVNPNGVFANDPLDEPDVNINTSIPIPLAAPLYLPNFGYKASEDSRVAFATQLFSNAPVPKLAFGSGLIEKLGIQRITLTSGMAFKVTDKLSVGGAIRINKAFLQVGISLAGENQLFGFLNAAVNDNCTTNQTRKTNESAFIYNELLKCADLYRLHQGRVDEGLARSSGYWPFIPWEPIATVDLEGETPLVYGWNFGVQWKPLPWITWGATYRTKEDDVFETDGEIRYAKGISTIFSGLANVPVLGALSSALLLDGSASDNLAVNVNIPWPKAFSTGLSIQAFKNAKINIEYRKYYYSDWESWEADIQASEIPALRVLNALSSNNTGTILDIPAGGVDTSYYAYGFEYQWNKRLAYRLGYEDRPFLGEESAIVPIYGIKLVSIGSEYKLTHDKVVDVGLTSILIDGTPNQRTTSSIASNPLDALTLRGAEYQQRQLDIHIMMFSASYTHRF